MEFFHCDVDVFFQRIVHDVRLRRPEVQEQRIETEHGDGIAFEILVDALLNGAIPENGNTCFFSIGVVKKT